MSRRCVGTPFVSVAFLVLIALALATSAVSTERDAFVHPNLIVSVSWLRQHTTDPHLRLVDARPTAEYDKGHLPGAVSRKRSGCQNITLAITPSDGVPCRHGHAPLITPGTLGTDSTRNPRLH